MIYLNPVFQNPAGTTYSEKRKSEVLDIVLAHQDVCILEDDPYSELYFNESDKDGVTPLKAMAPRRCPDLLRWNVCQDFGARHEAGRLLGPKDIVYKCELAKQSMDACSSTFTQVLADEYLRQGKSFSYIFPCFAPRTSVGRTSCCPPLTP